MRTPQTIEKKEWLRAKKTNGSFSNNFGALANHFKYRRSRTIIKRVIQARGEIEWLLC
jgi:hypothetical protein